MKIKIFGTLIVILALSLTVCEPDKDDDPECDCLANATREPDVPCCKGKDCTCPIAEPDIKTFSDIALFETYTATIKDERTNCGSATLQGKGTIAIIQKAFKDAYDNAEIWEQWDMEAWFNSGRVNIIVNNPATPYKIKVLDYSAIYFHFDYLQSNSDTIQQVIIGAVEAVVTPSPTLPYNVE